MAEAKLNKEQQIFVIQQFAIFEKATAIQSALKQIYEIEISLRAIVHYDIQNAKFPKKWQPLFDATRKEFIEKIEKIATANKSVRVKKLDRYVDEFENGKNYFGAAQILEQIAKEVGDVYTNKQRHELKINVRELTDEELEAIAQD